MESMTPVVSMQPQEEPTISVMIQNQEHSFMVDTGATYSCIGNTGSKLPLSGSSVKTVGFSGKTQIIPLTQPVPMFITGKSITAFLLYKYINTPINLLGRDILCPIKANIICTQEGLKVDFPCDHTYRLVPVRVMEKIDTLTQPAVYWIQWLPKSELNQKWETWRNWTLKQMGAVHKPLSLLHCTLMYDETQEHADYEKCWEEMINKKPVYMFSLNIYVGPQGAAAAVYLLPKLQQWFQVPDSAPHVTLILNMEQSSASKTISTKTCYRWHQTNH